jgi:hypothetical protein
MLGLLRKSIGGCFILCGVAWLSFLANDFCRIQFGHMGSEDVAFSFWIVIAAVTAPMASVFILIGIVMFAWSRIRSRLTSAAKLDEVS